MMQVTREYPFQILRLEKHGIFERTAASVTATAEGPLAEREGHLAALQTLSAGIETFLEANWTNRWLVSTGIECAHASQRGIQVAICPEGTRPSDLAEYLLLGVFEPIFREKGLLVCAVEFWVAGAERARAVVDRQIAEVYESELGYKISDYRHGAPSSPHIPIISSGMAVENRYSAYNFNRGKQPPRG